MLLLNKILLILLVIDSILLTLFITMYKTTDEDMLVSKSSGMPSMRGGESYKDFATRATKHFAIIFLLLCLGLGITSSRIAQTYKLENAPAVASNMVAMDATSEPNNDENQVPLDA